MKVPDYVATLKPYVAGKPIEELEREYGISSCVKLASNENPLGSSPKAVEAITGALQDLHRYPDSNTYHLSQRLAEKLEVGRDQIVIGNGSNEIIELMVSTFITEDDEASEPHLNASVSVLSASNGEIDIACDFIEIRVAGE